MREKFEFTFNDVHAESDSTLRIVEFKDHYGFDFESDHGSCFADATREELVEVAHAILEYVGEDAGWPEPELLESDERPLIINNYHGDIYY